MRTVPSSEPVTTARVVGREDQTTAHVIVVSAEHANQFARPRVPEPQRAIFRVCDDTRPVMAEETLVHDRGMPDQDGHQLPRDRVPEPRRLVRRGRDHVLAVRAEGSRIDLILVSGQHGERPAGGRVPEPRRAIRINASRKQSGAVRAEKHIQD